MVINEHPFKGNFYLADLNPLSRTIHHLPEEKQSCNIHKIIEPHIKMIDTESNVNRFLLLNEDFNICKCCMPNKHELFNKNISID